MIDYLEFYKKVPIVTPPNDLTELVERLSSVRRFIHPEYLDIFDDTVQSHTYRCVTIARNISGRESLKDGLERTLWIHDIPELIISDYTVIEKESNPELENRLDLAEEAAAKKLLSPKDQLLLWDFNNASDYMKGKKMGADNLSDSAIMAKVIDAFDGYIQFYYKLSEWIMSETYDKNWLPPEGALRHSFETRALFQKQIDRLPENYSKITMNNLLDSMNQVVVNLWLTIPEELRPDMIKEELRKRKG